jgi:gamma-glutamyl-gamma-aminobutyrate hydrolase PuuD
MISVALTMRVDVVPDRAEIRNSIDSRWIELACELNIIPILIPGHKAVSDIVLARWQPEAIVLTGGGNVHAVTGAVDERDCVERSLIDWALDTGRPILGVCRGMQAVLCAAGAHLVPLRGHVAVRHPIERANREVNSYHEFGVFELPRDFVALDRAPDGSIESCISRDGRVMGIMWHPERESPFHPSDIGLLSSHLGIARRNG